MPHKRDLNKFQGRGFELEVLERFIDTSHIAWQPEHDMAALGQEFVQVGAEDLAQTPEYVVRVVIGLPEGGVALLTFVDTYSVGEVTVDEVEGLAGVGLSPGHEVDIEDGLGVKVRGNWYG